VGAGSDGVIGTADDLLMATGETVAQIQDRVLGVGVASAPPMRELAGFVTVGFRGGFHLGRHEVIVDAENVTDRNYRGVSWGCGCARPRHVAGVRHPFLRGKPDFSKLDGASAHKSD
jgi:hypothetical protein